MLKTAQKLLKTAQKSLKIKKKKQIIEPNWGHILKEPYCMIRTYRGLKQIRALK